MNDRAVTALVSGLKRASINFVASLPSQSLGPAVCAIMNDRDFVHVPVANEGDALGICAGAYLGGKKPAFMGENAGLILALHSLINMMHYFDGFPILLVVDHRGDFGEKGGYWHFGCGIQLPPILECCHIPYHIVQESNKLIDEVVRGVSTAEVYGKPCAILLSGEEMYGH